MAVKKKAVKRTVKKTKKAGKVKKAKAVKPIGKVTHYYNRISVAIAKFHKAVPIGAVVAFKGSTTDFKTKIASMQLDHESIAKAPKGKEVGIKVNKPVREGDEVYLA